MSSPTLAEEFTDLISQYESDNELKGYRFDDFTGLDGDFLNEFLRKVSFSHRGSFLRLHRASRGSLRLFTLEFKSIPTGSSGVPHIHEDLEEFPMDQLRSFLPQESTTPLYPFHHQPDNEAEGKVFYSRGQQIQIHVLNLLKDIIRSCDYKVVPDTEAALNGLKVDIGVIRNRCGSICGTIEVKQPRRMNVYPADPDPMNHPKVVTQVLDQMIPLRALYGVKNVYGVLSTYNSWRFLRWVPNGEETEQSEELQQMVEDLSLVHPPVVGTTNPFATPQKARAGVDEHTTRNSPPPSPRPYNDADAGTEDENQEDETCSFDQIKRGTLYASGVISDGPVALKVLAWVLGEMEQTPIAHIPAHERDFLYVVRKDGSGGYEKLEYTPDHYKGRMPKSSNQKLYLLDELGHRYHGRVFRAMSKHGNLCVLKYFVKSQYVLNENHKRVQVETEAAAKKAVEYWNRAYDEWIPSSLYGKWGEGDAIIMPDLEKMSVDVDRDAVMPLLEQTMREKFFKRGIWHGDPSWHNVALIRDRAGHLSKVCMIDLEPQRMFEEVETGKWEEFETMWNEFRLRLDRNWKCFVDAETYANAKPGMVRQI